MRVKNESSARNGTRERVHSILKNGLYSWQFIIERQESVGRSCPAHDTPQFDCMIAAGSSASGRPLGTAASSSHLPYWLTHSNHMSSWY